LSDLQGGGTCGDESRPNVSFFVPAYNCEGVISEALDSIVESNLVEGDEIVVVDDASSDGTLGVIEERARRDGRLRIVRHRRNRGGGAARNTAVERALHPLLFCLDADNVLAPNSVGKLRDLLASTGSEVAAFEEVRYFARTVDETGHRWRFDQGVYDFEAYLSHPRVPGASGNYLFTKRSWVRAGGYPEFAGALDTWGFGLRQVATGSEMHVLPGSHYFHRFGYDSYYVRESRLRSGGIQALRVLMPFLHRLEEEDEDYLLSRDGHRRWMDELAERPLRLRPPGLPRPALRERLRRNGKRLGGRLGVLRARWRFWKRARRVRQRQGPASITP